MTGKGIKIALLDSGIDQSHPDLSGKIYSSINTTDEDPSDFNGHGTLLAGILVGEGAHLSGLYPGIAPDAQLFNIKVFNENGKASMADVLLGLDLLLDSWDSLCPDILVFGCRIF